MVTSLVLLLTCHNEEIKKVAVRTRSSRPKNVICTKDTLRLESACSY